MCTLVSKLIKFSFPELSESDLHMETNLVLFVCCYDLHAGIEDKAIFLICPTMKLYAN